MKKTPLDRTRLILVWVHIALDLVAIGVLLLHLLPDATKEIQYAIIFLSIITMLTVFINFLIYYEYRNELRDERQKSVEERKNLAKEHNIIIGQLSNSIKKISEEKSVLERRSRYADAMPVINYAFRQMHNTLRKGTTDREVFKIAFREFCQKLSDSFRLITNNDCHVCIKLLKSKDKRTYVTLESFKAESKNIYVETYVRSASSVPREIPDETKTVDHPVSKNTAYRDWKLEQNNSFYYFCNDLLTVDNIECTSILAWGGLSHVANSPGMSYINRQKEWKLPYKSIITIPIVPSIRETQEDQTILGFLCLDSPAQNQFLQDVDPQVLIGAVDGMFNALNKALEI